LFYCQHPALVRARTAFLTSTFEGHVPGSLARMFAAPAADRPRLRRVVRFVAECYTVVEAWYSSLQAGAAPPPVGLHPVLALLPADELDLFDSDSSSVSLSVDAHLDSVCSSRSSYSDSTEGWVEGPAPGRAGWSSLVGGR
jgi:hypothetical protein